MGKRVKQKWLSTLLDYRQTTKCPSYMGGTLKTSLLATGPLNCCFSELSKSASADTQYWVMFSDTRDGTDKLHLKINSYYGKV